MRGILKRVVWGLVLLVAVGGAVWLAWPRPVPADFATLKKAPMEVVVEDEGKTQVRHVYTLSAPIGGRILRISPPLHVGDEVTADQTVIAQMRPTVPSFLDVRSREELQAAVGAADAAVKLAEAEVRRIEAALEFAQNELRRSEALARTNVISAKALDKAKFDVETNDAALASARAQLEVRRSERASAAARLIDPSDAAAPANPSCCIQLRAPVTGRVLKIVQESEGMITESSCTSRCGMPMTF